MDPYDFHISLLLMTEPDGCFSNLRSHQVIELYTKLFLRNLFCSFVLTNNSLSWKIKNCSIKSRVFTNLYAITGLSMSYFMRVNLQWRHESFSSVEYSKPQFEQTTISTMYATPKQCIKPLRMIHQSDLYTTFQSFSCWQLCIFQYDHQDESMMKMNWMNN